MSLKTTPDLLAGLRSTILKGAPPDSRVLMAIDDAEEAHRIAGELRAWRNGAGHDSNFRLYDWGRIRGIIDRILKGKP